MIQIYAIMAHHLPDQLALLIDRLLPPDTQDRVVLHLDAGCDLWRHQRARFAAHPSGRLTLVSDPARVIWGHHSQIAAQQRLLREGLKQPFDYLHLISGADWPVRAPQQIAQDIGAFGPRRPIFAELWGETQTERMDDWWFERRKLRVPHMPRLNENIERAQIRASWAFSRWFRKAGLKRSAYAGQAWMKGSSWFSMPQDVAQVLLADYDRLLRSGRLACTQCADEHVAPSLFARSFADRLEADHRYIDWSAQGWHPKLLRAGDADAIRQSGAWFARKCDATVDDFFLRLPS
ncbi:beta-1,6-N-acetylglucosaminyltransferase [Novosphingobium rosa]|uniref:beta-1,6-N-acetylglucosaminyltransferase n=1 Tax=Novosphingobium rosa TaxID=76978 RepID=UPI00082C5D7B|nr:beta-1,6-N-acetylglucosaminyltransferase [Novosphingobium rosa]